MQRLSLGKLQADDLRVNPLVCPLVDFRCLCSLQNSSLLRLLLVLRLEKLLYDDCTPELCHARMPCSSNNVINIVVVADP